MTTEAYENKIALLIKNTAVKRIEFVRQADVWEVRGYTFRGKEPIFFGWGSTQLLAVENMVELK